jgi:membrane protease YdiL (CAAX protease family)
MLRTTLADFRNFLRAPHLAVPAPLHLGWRRWTIMVATYLAGLVIIGTGLTVWQRTQHLPAPEAFNGFSAPVLAAIVVLIAPLGEETLFRGWLTGRPRALWLVLMAMLAALLLRAVAAHWHEVAVSIGMVVVALAAPVGWFVLRRRTAAPRWFARRFAVWFYLSDVVFGLMHLTNYPRLSWALVPMVLPQVWAGLVFGYLRMRNGLWAGILAHAVGNAAALATALLAGL